MPSGNQGSHLKNGQFGISEVEIGEDIAPASGYLPLHEPEVFPDLNSSVFTYYNLNESQNAAQEGCTIKPVQDTGAVSEDSMDEHGKALRLNGTTLSYVAPLADAAKENRLRSDEDFTLSMWIKPDSVNNGSDQLSLAHQRGTSGGRTWLFIYQGKLGSYLGIENNCSSKPIKAGEWTHAAVTLHILDASKKQAQMTMYQNGEQVCTKKFTIESDDFCLPELVMGTHKNGKTAQYKGLMDDMTLFKKALSADEIRSLYEEGGSMDLYGSQETHQYQVTEVLPLSKIAGKAGETTLESIALPTNVTAVFEDTYSAEVHVVWDSEDLAAVDFSKPGVWEVHGSLQLDGLSNAANEANIQPVIRNELKEPVSLAELQSVLESINSLNQEDYTPESFEAFMTACQNVQTKNTMLMIGQYPEKDDFGWYYSTDWAISNINRTGKPIVILLLLKSRICCKTE